MKRVESMSLLDKYELALLTLMMLVKAHHKSCMFRQIVAARSVLEKLEEN